MKDLTKAQIDGLIRIRDRGPLAWCEWRGRAGGAVARMMDRLVAAGLLTGPPYEITKLGRTRLEDLRL